MNSFNTINHIYKVHKGLCPDFEHIETGKNLDQKM